MPKRSKRSISCLSDASFRLESLVSVDERGQMVLPKDVRERAGIRPGEKLALIMAGSDSVCNCLALVKVKDLTGMIKELLGPLANDIRQYAETDTESKKQLGNDADS
jgi:antitoxin PrlF